MRLPRCTHIERATHAAIATYVELALSRGTKVPTKTRNTKQHHRNNTITPHITGTTRNFQRTSAGRLARQSEPQSRTCASNLDRMSPTQWMHRLRCHQRLGTPDFVILSRLTLSPGNHAAHWYYATNSEAKSGRHEQQSWSIRRCPIDSAGQELASVGFVWDGMMALVGSAPANN